mgnify:FL=1
MQLSSDFEKVRDLAKKTMALMQERGIRQTPPNYAIWYEYIQESNPNLTRAVNEALAKNGKFTEKIGAELYDRFFTREQESKAVEETSRLVQQSMDSMMGDLTRTNNDISSYGEQLHDFATRAEGLNGIELQAVIDQIITQTHSVSDNTRSLQNGLESASREIADLKRRLQFVQKEAYTDSLTGIANRKSFDEHLAKMIGQTKESGATLCLIIADIDHFKQFNDTHGHTFGDQVIKLVAATLSKGIDHRAMAARYGGEEFGIILPETPISDAVNLANDLRMAISAKKLVKRSTKTEVGKITMSFGVTSYARPEDAIGMINRADKALYEAKKTGRNCVKHLRPII